MNLRELDVMEAERRRWQDPEETLRRVGLREGHSFADIGCGYGFFTEPAARIVGSAGEVYAVDSDPGGIDVVRRRLDRARLSATLVTGRAEDTVFCGNCMDIVFFSIVLHDFSDPLKVLGNSRRMIKVGGTLVDIDWKKEARHMGPPTPRKFSVEKAASLIRHSGFSVVEVDTEHDLLYTILAKPV